MIKAVIFDLDGVLADTEQLHAKSYVEVLKNHGVELTEGEFYEYWTAKGQTITDFVKRRQFDLNPAKLRKEKTKLYHEKLEKELQAYDGTEKTLSGLSKKYPLCLVSNSFKHDVDKIMSLTGLSKHFKFMITIEDLTKGTPDPEGFLLASKKLGIMPNECVVVEDAAKGLAAAKSAGMKCVIIPNKYTAQSDFTQADLVLQNISQLTMQIIENLNA